MIQITIGQPFYVGEWRPVVHGVLHQIVAIFFICQSAGGRITLSNEHDDYQWIAPQNAANLPL